MRGARYPRLSGNESRRRPPTVIWLLGAMMGVLALACTVLAVLAWQEADQIDRLVAEVDDLQEERRRLDERLAEAQETAAIVAHRLQTLEASDPAGQLATLQAEMDEVLSRPGEAAGTPLDGDGQGALAAIQATLDQVLVRLDALEVQASGAAGAVDGLPAVVRLQVPRLQQAHNLSCESAAAAMVAGYHDVALTEAEVLAALPLDPNPHLGFRGNIDGPTGGIVDYGVYAGPILGILQARGFQALLVEGGLPGIRAAVARGHPVIAWMTYNCLPATPVTETVDGQEVVLVPNQHVVVVTGYGDEGFWANDPWDGLEDFYTEADLARAMGYLGNMAIEVGGPQEGSVAP